MTSPSALAPGLEDEHEHGRERGHARKDIGGVAPGEGGDDGDGGEEVAHQREHLEDALLRRGADPAPPVADGVDHGKGGGEDVGADEAEVGLVEDEQPRAQGASLGEERAGQHPHHDERHDLERARDELGGEDDRPHPLEAPRVQQGSAHPQIAPFRRGRREPRAADHQGQADQHAQEGVGHLVEEVLDIEQEVDRRLPHNVFSITESAAHPQRKTRPDNVRGGWGCVCVGECLKRL